MYLGRPCTDPLEVVVVRFLGLDPLQDGLVFMGDSQKVSLPPSLVETAAIRQVHAYFNTHLHTHVHMHLKPIHQSMVLSVMPAIYKLVRSVTSRVELKVTFNNYSVHYNCTKDYNNDNLIQDQNNDLSVS